MAHLIEKRNEGSTLRDSSDEADTGGSRGVELEANANLPVFRRRGLQSTGLCVALLSEDFDGDVCDLNEVASRGNATDE